MTPEERREYMRKWRLAHKEKIAVYNATYYYKYRESLLANQRKNYKDSKDEINATRRERYHTDPEYREKVSKSNQRWRCKKRLEDNKGECK